MHEPASKRRPQLRTTLVPDKLQKRLTKIFREERTLEEEQGLSTLYLALGFLKWFDSDQAENSFAPLLLIPVTLIRVPGGDGYLLRGRDDDIVANVSLREKLQSNFGIQLPELPDGEEWKPSDYFREVTREIARQARWEVDDSAIGLGFFTFSKFMMWRDLNPASWPNNSLLDHPLLSILLGQGVDFDTSQPIVPDDESIDEHIDLSKCTHVVDADSSQAIVIEEACGGRNIVVQGPPGTGKSQTITNLIASAAHEGKSILFVAEKAAALEVVYDRLRKVGLSALCLELHSRKANKKEVLKSLEQAIRFSGVSRVDPAPATKLAHRRDQLNGWSDAIHQPIGNSGRTPFNVIGSQVKLRADGTRLLENRLESAADWSAEKLTSIEVAIDRAAEAVLRLTGAPKSHPWFGTDIAPQSPFDLDRLVPTLSSTFTKLVDLATQMKQVFPLIADDHVPSFTEALATISAFRHVAAAPKNIRRALANSIWERELVAIESATDDGRRLSGSIISAEQHFRDEAWGYDAGSLLIVLRADGPSFLRRFGSRYRKGDADLHAICLSKPPKQLQDRIALVETLKRAQGDRRELANKATLLSSALGPLWAGHKTNWSDVASLVGWTRRASAEIGGVRLLKLAARSADLDVFSVYAEKLNTTCKTALEAFTDLQTTVQADPKVVFGNQDFTQIPITQLLTKISVWQSNSEATNEWVAVRNTLSTLQTQGLGFIADGLTDGSIRPNEARPITELLIAESLWRRATKENPNLSSIEGDARTESVAEFCTLDQQKIRAARQEVMSRYLQQRPTGYAGAMGIIRAEIEKKRGHRPIRKLITDAGTAVRAVKANLANESAVRGSIYSARS